MNQNTNSRMVKQDLKQNNFTQLKTSPTRLKTMTKSLKSKKDLKRDPNKACNLGLER